MNPSTIIVAAIVAVIFLAIVITEIRNRKKGKHSCSCGGSCGTCGGCSACHTGSGTHVKTK
ncbi:MAG: FeoB-associated Cys-rich membrane protein [Clostridia bacterium]|nr:FeoB-associated Cys-rich membrane protein [Clostridia bacterium]